MSEIVDSHLRCPFDGKRMVVEIGQDDATGDGGIVMRHECWHCGYHETDRRWSPTVVRQEGTVEAHLADVKMLRQRQPLTVLTFDGERFVAGAS